MARMVPVNTVANVTLLDTRTLGVQLGECGHGFWKVEKAIRDCDLGLNPATQGEVNAWFRCLRSLKNAAVIWISSGQARMRECTGRRGTSAGCKRDAEGPSEKQVLFRR